MVKAELGTTMELQDPHGTWGAEWSGLAHAAAPAGTLKDCVWAMGRARHPSAPTVAEIGGQTVPERSLALAGPQGIWVWGRVWWNLGELPCGL